MTKLCAFCDGVWLWTVIAAVVLTTLLDAATLIQGTTIADMIENDRELSQFKKLFELSNLAQTLVNSESVTVFAPTNTALNRYNGPYRNSAKLLMCHIVKSALTSENFPTNLNSEVEGGSPLFVTRNLVQSYVGPTQKYEYFVNNARIIKLDLRGLGAGGTDQVLHVIDEVLELFFPNPDDVNSRNPSAYRLISNPALYGVTYDFSELVKQSRLYQKDMILQGGEKLTFFLPVNGDNMELWNRVDGKVIDAHIIPDKAFFVRTFPQSPQESMAYIEMLKTSLLLTNESDVYQRDYQLNVQSNTAIGYADYPKGVVVSKVLQANIPVRNGVVHIIENPLVVNNKNVFQLLEQTQRIEEFKNLIYKYNSDILDDLKRGPVTLFAPSNKAFQSMDSIRLAQVVGTNEKLRQLLRLHVVPDSINSERIIRDQTMLVPTRDNNRRLHLRHVADNITVLGGGVTALVTTADISALNGYLHIIDKILGIPYGSIYEKLKSSELSDTFRLGTQRNFNNMFTNLSKVFTYFVPSNDAWKKVQQKYTSEYKKLFSEQYSYQVEKILERHLVKNHRYSLQDLITLGSVQTVQGVFSFSKSGDKYFVEWEGEAAEIIDSDVETTNGVVHVIGNVLFKRRDLTNEAAKTLVHVTSIVSVVLSTALVMFIV